MTRDWDLEGRTALITGSSRGIGRALAVALADAGAKIAVHSQTTGSADAVAAEIVAAGGTAAALAADLNDAEQCTALADAAAAAFGGIDILVLNASYEGRMGWADVTPAVADLHWRVNFGASLTLCQRLAPPMVARGWGRIVAIGSVQEVRPNPALIAYAATKAAQASLVATLARELGGSGVTVNNLAPGAIATDRNAAVLADARYRARVEAQIPAGRVGTPQDCVGACLLLASDAGGYINGATLRIDGGWHL